jgi:hypothetical protein
MVLRGILSLLGVAHISHVRGSLIRIWFFELQ